MTALNSRGRQSGTVSGRRLCAHPEHRGPRWLHVTDFPPHRWNPDGSIRYVQSYCRGCRNRVQVKSYHDHTPDQRLRRNEYERIHHYRHRNGHLPPEFEEKRVAVESFRPYWESILNHGRQRFLNERAGGFQEWDAAAFRTWLGLSLERYATLTRYMTPAGHVQTLPLDLCDQVLTAAGMEHVVSQLYVVSRVVS